MELKSFDLQKIGIIVLGFSLVIIAFVTLATSGASSTRRLYGQLKEEQKQIEIVKTNIQTLKKIDLAVVNKTEQVFMAMPNKSLVPLLLSNVKVVSEGNFVVEDLKSESFTPVDQINGTSLVYEGLVDEISKGINVIETLQDFVPLTSIQELTMKTSETGGYNTTMKITTFWADLPTELPQINEPVKELTADEVKVMNDIYQLKRPGTSNIEPQAPIDRANPFIL